MICGGKGVVKISCKAILSQFKTGGQTHIQKTGHFASLFTTFVEEGKVNFTPVKNSLY